MSVGTIVWILGTIIGLLLAYIGDAIKDLRAEVRITNRYLHKQLFGEWPTD